MEVEGEDRLDMGVVKIADGMHARAGRLALNARMADARAAQLLAALPGGMEFLLRIKFLREKVEDDWVFEDKFAPVRAERKKGQGVVEVAPNTSPGVLTGITVCSIRTPTPSPQLPIASTPSETQTRPTSPR